jgi:hypothetical protein
MGQQKGSFDSKYPALITRILLGVAIANSIPQGRIGSSVHRRQSEGRGGFQHKLERVGYMDYVYTALQYASRSYGAISEHQE